MSGTDNILAGLTGLAQGINEIYQPYIQSKIQMSNLQKQLQAQRESAIQSEQELAPIRRKEKISELESLSSPLALRYQKNIAEATRKPEENVIPLDQIPDYLKTKLGIRAPVNRYALPSAINILGKEEQLNFKKNQPAKQPNRNDQTLRQIVNSGGTIPPQWNRPELLDYTPRDLSSQMRLDASDLQNYKREPWYQRLFSSPPKPRIPQGDISQIQTPKVMNVEQVQ